MKYIYSLSIVFVSLCLMGQDQYESYDHNMLLNYPIHAYEYKGGLVTVNYMGKRGLFSPNINYSTIYFNYIDQTGTITQLGISYEMDSRRVMHDIKFELLPDSTLSILASDMFDYDIPYFGFDKILFDGENVEFTSVQDFDLFAWGNKVTGWGESCYIFSQLDSVFVVDENLKHLKTLEAGGTQLESTIFNDEVLLYNDSIVYNITPDTILNTLFTYQDIELIYQSHGQLYIITTGAIELYTDDFEHIQTLPFPESHRFTRKFYTAGNEVHVELKDIDNKDAMWKSTDGNAFERILFEDTDSHHFHFIYPTTEYDFYLSSYKSDNHRQGMVNKLQKGLYEESYDQIVDFSIADAEIQLDSISYGGTILFMGEMDYYDHYYSGSLTVSNDSGELISKSSAHSRYHDILGYFYPLTIPIQNVSNGDVITYPVSFKSRDDNNTGTLDFRIFGANDRRLIEPISFSAPIIASSHELSAIEFSLYPNPTSQGFSVTLENDESIESVSLYNAKGQLCKTYGDLNSFYPIDDLESGLYFVVISTQNGSIGIKSLTIKD